MPFFFSFIAQIFRTAIFGGFAVSVVAAVLRGLGFGLIVYLAVNTLSDNLVSFVTNQLGDIPGNIVAVLEILGILNALNILFSGYLSVLTVVGFLGAGRVTRQAWNPPANTPGQGRIFPA